MKTCHFYLLLTFAFTVLLCGCEKSNEELVAESIKQELNKTLPSFEGYAPVSTELIQLYNNKYFDPVIRKEAAGLIVNLRTNVYFTELLLSGDNRSGHPVDIARRNYQPQYRFYSRRYS